MRIASWGGLAAALATLMLAGTAVAQPSKGQRFGDWGVGCEAPPGGPEKCFVQQSQLLKDGNKRVLNLVIGRFGPSGEAMMVATFPLGINLQFGAAYRLDEQTPQPVKILQCVPDGCIGTVILDPPALERLRAGKKLVFAVLPFGSDKTVAVSASLDGLASALDALKP